MTAEEHIKRVESITGEPFDKKYLEDILIKDRAEYRESIIKMIVKKIEERKLLNQIFDTDAAWMAKIHNEEIKDAGIIALTEIRDKIKEMK